MLLSPVRPSARFVHPLAAGLLVAVLAFVAIIIVPQLSGPGLHAHDGHLTMILVHLLGGSLMLMAGATALWMGLSGRAFRWHRPAGVTYVAAGSLSVGAGLYASFGNPHSPGLSTLMLGIVWFGCVGMALRAIAHRRIDQHRAWMIRSYAVAWASILFRLLTHLLPAAWQFPPTDMLWTSWVMPLFVTELLLQWRSGAASL